MCGILVWKMVEVKDTDVYKRQLSNCVACLYFFVLLLIKRGKTYVCINPKQFSFRRDIVSGVCAVGVPASIQNLLNVTGMTILNNFSSAYGADAVAAIGICQKIYMVPMYVSQGISQGVMPLVSYNYSDVYKRQSIICSSSSSFFKPCSR